MAVMMKKEVHVRKELREEERGRWKKSFSQQWLPKMLDHQCLHSRMWFNSSITVDLQALVLPINFTRTKINMASIISIRRRQRRHILRTARDLVTTASKATMIGRRRRVMTRITTTSTLISVTTLPAPIAEVIHTRLAHNHSSSSSSVPMAPTIPTRWNKPSKVDSPYSLRMLS